MTIKNLLKKKIWQFGEEILKTSETRLNFIKNYYHVPIFNIGQHNPRVDKPWYKRLHANF